MDPVTNNNQNLLLQVEKISHEAVPCSLDFTKIKDVQAVNDVAGFLSITCEQAVLFSCIVELSLQRNVTLENLARYLKCSVLKIVARIHEIDALEKQGLVKKRVRTENRKPAYNDLSYTVPQHVIEALRISDITLVRPKKGLKFTSLLKQVSSLVRECEETTFSSKQLFEEIENILLNNPDHHFIKYINQKLAGVAGKCISLTLAYYRLKGQGMTDMDSIISSVFDDIDDQLEFRSSVINGRNELIKSGMMSLERTDFGNYQVLMLTPCAVKILYKDYPELIMQELSKEGLIKHKNIREKTLFFNASLQEQVNDFIGILGKAKFKRFRQIAEKCNMSRGITALFYGNSGTGKTELALQIAKKSGRDLFLVDLSQTKSMWFGESEKQVKKIFDDYRELLQTTTHIPILFVNEADGLFSKRLDIGAKSSGVSQTQNTIQNIILQELETFKGILIATTNLTGNLDKAFERRFLFKIEFTKPLAGVRQRIWVSKLPGLSMKQAGILAEKFELTGGQIDNQIRQLVLKKVLDENLDMFEWLMENCAKDQGFSQIKRVGF